MVDIIEKLCSFRVMRAVFNVSPITKNEILSEVLADFEEANIANGYVGEAVTEIKRLRDISLEWIPIHKIPEKWKQGSTKVFLLIECRGVSTAHGPFYYSNTIEEWLHADIGGVSVDTISPKGLITHVAILHRNTP